MLIFDFIAPRKGMILKIGKSRPRKTALMFPFIAQPNIRLTLYLRVFSVRTHFVLDDLIAIR
jgi:hypothetical protein